jgi:type VI secretion system protein ImpF
LFTWEAALRRFLFSAMDTYAPSLLDKLLGETSDTAPRGVAPRWSAEQVKASVARDIELLLNAHATYTPDELAGLPMAAHSLLTLGLPDIASMSIDSDRDRLRITEAIRQALVDHDRRLQGVDVRVRPSERATGGVAFTIRARLQLQPGVEPVSFDAVLQPGSHRYAVARSDPRGPAA